MKFVKQVNILRYKSLKYDTCKSNIYSFQTNFMLEESIKHSYSRKIMYCSIILGFFITEDIF